MDAVLQSCQERMKKSILSLQEEFNNIRTGRANISLFEKIKVEYYGNPTPLNQVANLSVPEARLIVIQPWDKSLIAEIEKAIQKSDLSLNPSSDGKIIRIQIPPLTEERRKELVKKAKASAEGARVAVRNIRRDSNLAISKLDSMSKDEAAGAQEEIQKHTDSFIKDINSLLELKEKEIMEV